MAVDRLESTNFPYLPVRLTLDGDTYDEDMLIDTGYEGYVAVPEGWGQGRQPRGYRTVALADGSLVRVPYFRGFADIGGLGEFECTVFALGDELILGRFATNRYSLTLDHGQRVIVEA